MKPFARLAPLSRLLHLTALLLIALALGPGRARGQTWATLANPDWNITLTDAGYSDFLLDNTPGFEGREYLSGEWGTAIGYQIAGITNVTAEWLEPQFVFPNWTTDSSFQVTTPIAVTGLNADGLPIAESVIANAHVEITLRFEMVDTVVGTPLGTTPASAASAPTFLHSNRYVLKQSYTIRNIAGTALSNIQLFQLLHGLNSQRGVFDNRLYTGPLSTFRYDTALAGVDPWSAGASSSSAGLEDYIGFHAQTAPTAHEIGYYGIEGNGVDDHAFGKPSAGVHLSIEDNWQHTPFSTQQGTDSFAPAKLWIAGAQRWDLGNLPAGQSVTFDMLLTILTGTRVNPGTGSGGSCNGGSSVPGGFDYEFEDVAEAGSCFGDFSRADDDELAVLIAAGEFEAFDFPTPAKPAQVWEIEFSGQYNGNVTLNLAYDATLLPAGFNEDTLTIFHYTGGNWQALTGTVDPVTDTISVTTSSLGKFVLGAAGGTTYTVAATVAPANSGTITGAGSYASGSSATLAATPAAGYVFTNWTENAAVVSSSPNLLFTVTTNRTLVGNFTPAGANLTVATSSLPINGGTTGGGGAYAEGSSATVTAAPTDGYKFSKWLDNGVVVSTTASYTFTVSSNRVLVAKFKPVYTMVVSAEPPEGGEVEADPVYEPGELAKLKAKPTTGYSFVNWTQNGVVVSTKTNYEFNVTGNRTLVGNFALGNRIDLIAEPINAGAVTGGGIHLENADVTVEADAKPGYVFLNWIENGTEVSTAAAYTFTSTASRTLTANFTALPVLLPTLPSAGTLLLSWPAGMINWVLQHSPDLSPGSWTDFTDPVSVVDGHNQVTIPLSPTQGFYRLRHP